MRALLLIAAALVTTPVMAQTAQRWTTDKANAWYARQPWPVGANYIPASAINQLEMWQATTFDPAGIDRELGWAKQKFGMNTMRVYLHDLAWEQDRAGFKRRLDTFLTIAAKHGIRPVLVIFDSCWDPDPVAGPQHRPIPGVHNSGWVQSPGRRRLVDAAQEETLHAYVSDVVGSFAKDPRILAWDVWNEPDNPGGGSYNGLQLANEEARVAALLPRVFSWARAAGAMQPLTSAPWRGGDWTPGAAGRSQVERTQLDESDVVTFHNYEWPEAFERRVRQLQGYGRPIICSEWMARGAGSTADTMLPIARRLNVGMINWGLVDGKTQTKFPWDSWERPYTLQPPTVWFHDLMNADGTPYRAREAELFRTTAAETPAQRRVAR